MIQIRPFTSDLFLPIETCIYYRTFVRYSIKVRNWKTNSQENFSFL